MNQTNNRDRIVEYLRIKPISHGQVYTFQIAIPESDIMEIPYEKHEYIKRSLSEQGTNLMPLIVRRTDAYTEEEDYEVVYGVDWCLVAKELDIEKLWVWVFNMTDEQALTTKKEMEQFLGYFRSMPELAQPVSQEIEFTKTILHKLDTSIQQVEMLSKKIDQMTVSINNLESRENTPTATGDRLVQQLTEAVKKILEQSKSKEDLRNKKKDELKELAKQRGIKVTSSMSKDALIRALETSTPSYLAPTLEG